MQLDPDWLEQQGADRALLAAVDGACTDLPERIGVAVSGGGDSVALLHLAATWSEQTGRAIEAVTVDHRLRADSRAEAEGVAVFCQSLGINHSILDWEREDGAGNLSAAARDGRYALMAQWAKARGVGAIVLGHTLDDSAENFVMRLGRASGLDGLAEMARVFERYGMTWARPLAGCARGNLREYLRRHGVPWVEDPSNDDPAYLRSRVRAALPALAELGVTAPSIQASAAALRASRDALAHYVRKEAAVHVRQEGGDLLIAQDIGANVPRDVVRRITLAALQWVGGRNYAPRRSFTGVLSDDLGAQERLTVGGCLIMRRKGAYRITREFDAVKGLVSAGDALWDGRWRLNGPQEAGLEVRAFGESVNDVPDWRETGVPRPTLVASPAVWRGETLVAAPLAGHNDGWSAQIVADFTSFLDSH